ncbi:MAG TPA: ASCH domain-containing protein [Candidatus Paceibacterota bacterium]
MATYQMKLQPSPFEKIKDGEKTIEVRLNDEKRQLLKVGDSIEFSLMTDPTQTIKTDVVGLEKFPTFKEMFAAYPVKEYGGENQEEWKLMYKYYSPEDEAKYGVLAIQVKASFV